MYVFVFLFVIAINSLFLCGATSAPSTTIKAAVWIVDKTKSTSNIQQFSRSMEMSDLINYIDEKIPNVNAAIILESSSLNHRILMHEEIVSSINKSPSAALMPNIYASETSDENVLKSSKHFKNAKDLSLTKLAEEVKKSHKSSLSKTFSVQLMPNSNEERSLLQEIQNTAENVMFIVVERPSGSIPQKPSRQSELSRILMTTDTTTQSNNIFYKPEGAEYSIYYAATYLYITPDIFTGLLTMLFMAFTIYIGLNCLGSIQTPSTFALSKPSVGREA